MDASSFSDPIISVGSAFSATGSGVFSTTFAFFGAAALRVTFAFAGFALLAPLLDLLTNSLTAAFRLAM